jgi:small subunit ribosomal protein S8
MEKIQLIKMMNDTLSSALSAILNAERLGRRKCLIKPQSKIIKEVLRIMHENGYLGEYSEIEDGRGNILEANLLGSINKCGAIKPRFSVASQYFEKFEKRFLPAKDFGILILSTPKGMMTHADAKKIHVGGRLIAYCY